LSTVTPMRWSSLEFGLYFATNVLTRGVLAVLGIIAARSLDFGATATAMLVGAGVLSMRFGRLFVAPMSRYGSRTTAAAGHTLSAAGFLLLACGQVVPALAWVGVVVFGVGYGAVVLGIKVYLVGRAEDARERLGALAWLAVALNLGAALGPIAAGLLLAGPGPTGALLLAAVGALLSAALTLRMPSTRVDATDRFRWSALRRATEPDIAVSLVSLVIAFAMYAQLASVLPLHVESSIGVAWVGLVFAGNAILVVAAQLPITRLSRRFPWVDRYSGPIGTVLFATGFAALAASTHVATLVICVVMVSLAECLVLPFVERDLADRLSTAGLAAAFTLSAAAMGVGETLGSVVGVRATLSSSAAFTHLMTSLAVIGAVASLLLTVVIRYRINHREGTAP